ncbi:TonB-dependent siderophore receptor [Actomonas aquatica]|uniref:TonB-dependent receptor plug domain-containing protein n=1 Tax=Actomonas aquatica TaxID=2866162 RepID=A0ABZ1CB22_9BACT|nr:TonB-dependent receptor plug domain-containing protein [Opitutus sp. WL0086]WRQ88873.1 TonB-dependent receptor plug domain-containing protein [Opitutus sp. WL0086]
MNKTLSNLDRVTAAVSLAAASASFLISSATAQETTDDVLSLEAFILEETGGAGEGDLLQNSRPIGSVFLGEQSALDTPRSVTVLTPEAMKQFAVKDFSDLDRVGAGMTRPNIFGLPGLPFMRGNNAGVYYNGMRRIANQNETPTSFGSLDAMDLVKGPAPAQLGPTNAGGYANFIPKSPYFDQRRGSVEFTLGSYDFYNTKVDIGGPMMIGDKPMAYRVSITNQQADSYYDAVRNDYISVYAAAKAKLTPKLSFYSGFEYYDFKSNENAGWNRVTQDLIDNGNYIIGEMDPNTVSAVYNGTADPGLLMNQVDIAYATGYDPNLAIVVREADFLAAYPNLGGAAAFATPVYYNGDLFGYKYTPEYFANGGTALTRKIEGNQVLSDPSDYADSTTFLWFADLVYHADSGSTITAKTFFESLETRKLSSYGFAHDSDSWAVEEKLSVDSSLELGGVDVSLQYGADVRYTYNNDANDFGVEPFNRRDVSSSDIPAWSYVYTGPLYDWDPTSVGLPGWFVGGSQSKLTQLGAFAQFKAGFGEKFSLFGGARVERADFSYTSTAKEFPATPSWTDGDTDYVNWSINPVFKPASWISFYGAIQGGTAFEPGQTGGAASGEGNFLEAPFYEGGVKVSSADGKFFASFAAYQYEKTSLSLNVTGVDTNAYEAEGYEFELTWAPTDNFTIVGNIGELEARYVDRYPFATYPFYNAENVALYSGAIQYSWDARVVGESTGRYANNPEGIRSGYPQMSWNLFAVYNFDNGFGLGVGPSYKEDFWLDNERTLKLPDSLVWNANVFYKTDSYEVFLRLNNFTDEDYFIGSSFAPTMIVTKAKPFEAQLSLKVKF